MDGLSKDCYLLRIHEEQTFGTEMSQQVYLIFTVFCKFFLRQYSTVCIVLKYLVAP
jgi:hypothetical protein